MCGRVGIGREFAAQHVEIRYVVTDGVNADMANMSSQVECQANA